MKEEFVKTLVDEDDSYPDGEQLLQDLANLEIGWPELQRKLDAYCNLQHQLIESRRAFLHGLVDQLCRTRKNVLELTRDQLEGHTQRQSRS